MDKECTIYTSEGWLDIPAIASMGCWLNVIIGARQVGKTYGVSKFLLDSNTPFIYMRRTSEEFKAICGDAELDPWVKMDQEGYLVRMQKIKGASTYAIGDVNNDGKVEYRRGIGMSLSSVATIRGFAGDQYTDLMFDEFIPEKFVVVRRMMGDAFVNAIKTISGNRELQEKPPLRIWLLANSNSIDSPILSALNLIDDLDLLIRSGKEYCVTNNGVFIGYPKSENIIGKQKMTKFMKQIQGTAVSDMMENKGFAYDDLSKIKPHTLNGWKPYVNVGNYGVWEHDGSLYVSTTRGKCTSYGTSTPELTRLNRDHPELLYMATSGLISYYSIRCYLDFKSYVDNN